jgi:hypothetical protein
MKNNGDMYLYSLVNASIGLGAFGIGVNMILRNPHTVTGYLPVFGGICLMAVAWIISSSVHFRTYGFNAWWSSRRFYKISKHEKQVGTPRV